MSAIESHPRTSSTATSSAIKSAYGDWFRQIGAIEGGQTVARDELMLRFPSHAQALGASAALSDVVDGVRIRVCEQNGESPQGNPSPGDVISLLSDVHGVVRAQLRRIPEPGFVITSESPDVNARLDPILRDSLFDVPVRWETGS